MEIDLLEKVMDKQLGALREAEKLTKLIPKARRMEEVLRRWKEWQKDWHCGLDYYGQIALTCRVDRIKDIEPFLEHLENGLNVSFDKSWDIATESMTNREFKCSEANWFLVDARLREDGPGCCKVIVGYSPAQPIYKIQCLETIDAPAQLAGPDKPALPAPSPERDDDDIPF